MKLIKCKKPKGFLPTKLYFSNLESANEYLTHLKNDFLLKKAEALEYPDLSKRKRKVIYHSKPKRYILTKVGSKFLLWMEIK